MIKLLKIIARNQILKIKSATKNNVVDKYSKIKDSLKKKQQTSSASKN